MGNPLFQAVGYIMSVISTWFNTPLPGTNIGIGYVFFAAISIPVAFAIVHRFVRGM